MRRSMKVKVGAVGTTFVLAGALAVVASGATGAYFSDTKTGDIQGTAGNMKISTVGSTGDGADNLKFTFVDLMPGEAQTVTVNFENTGRIAQDVYLTFPNRSALHALNNVGTWGEVRIVDAAGVEVFHSTNLNDGRKASDTGNSCGTFSPTVGPEDYGHCWPLQPKVKVASNVAKNAQGSFTFSFNSAAKTTGGQNGVFNVWPVTVAQGYPDTEAFGLDAVGSGIGLPINVVATQVGKG